MKTVWLSIGVLLAGLSCSVCSGQTLATSQVSGNVTDQSGAVIPNAKIQITRVDTGVIHTTTTNSSGAYILPDLPAGNYSLQVTASGFKSYVQKGITLDVGTNPEFNVNLSVGAVTQQVVVQTINAQVETESNGVGQVIDQTRVVDMPLNGRDPDQLIMMAGAATTFPAGDLNSNKNFPTIAISVAGGLENGVEFVLDGGIHNEATNGLNLPQPMPDSLQEFKVETSALPAQYGDHAAATINAITRSGGNDFHGDAFEFIRNYLFNAQNFFSSSTLTPYKDGLKRNQFGGTVGGPIIRDRLFFFGGLQDSIVRAIPTASYTQVPTAAMMQGDFSQVTAAGVANCQSSAITLTGPDFATIGGVPNQFVGGMAAMSSQALAAMKFIPYALPNGATAPTALTGYPHLTDVTSIATKGAHTGNCGYVQVKIPGNSRQDNAIGRVDYTVNSKNSIFARYFLGINFQPIPADPTDALNEQAVQQYNRDQGVTAGDTYIFSQNLVNALRLTANRVVNLRVVQPFFDPSVLGIAQVNSIPGYMNVGVTNGYTVGGGTTNLGHFNSTTWQFIDDVSYIHGNHEFGVGADYLYSIMDTVNTRPTNGEYAFTGQEYSSNASYGYADYFAGAADTFAQGLPDLENDGQSRFALYAQDSWKLTKRLTLNYGLRWEPYLPEHNSDDHSENFDMANFTAGTTSTVFTKAPAGMIFDGDAQMSGNHYNFPVYDIFDPRVGLIWDPFGDGKTSVRASYGTFHDSPQMFFNTRYSNSPPFGSTVSLNNVPFANPWATYAGGDPFPALDSISKTETFPTEGIYVNSPLHIKVMYLEQWNLSLQRQVGSWLFSASYLGNRTVHLETANEADPAMYIPGTSTGAAGSCTSGTLSLTGANLPASGKACSSTGNYNARRLLYQLNPAQGVYYSTIGTYDPEGISDYNGMLVSVQRHAKNMNILANYTWAHCLSEAETTELTGPTYLIPPAYDPNGRRESYSNCDSDHRQTLNTALILNTPSFNNQLLKTVVTNWQFSPIFTAQTGGFSTITTGTDNTLANTGNSIATNPANPYGTRSDFGTQGYLVAGSNFTAPVTGTFNYARPYSLHGLPTYELDMGLIRTFPIYHLESQNVQFRWEVFNLTNEAILGGAGSTTTEGFGAGTGGGFGATTSSSTFGDFTTAGNPRIMQFALKYNF